MVQLCAHQKVWKILLLHFSILLKHDMTLQSHRQLFKSRGARGNRVSISLSSFLNIPIPVPLLSTYSTAVQNSFCPIVQSHIPRTDAHSCQTRDAVTQYGRIFIYYLFSDVIAAKRAMLTQYFSRVVKWNKFFFKYFTTFFMSTSCK